MLGLTGMIKTITALVVAFAMQFSMAGVVDETPKQAATEFMDGITHQQEEVLDLYMENQYVNFLANVEMGEKTGARFRESLLGNLSYEIVDKEERDDLAVVKLTVKGNDFSKVMKNYEKASYDYVTEHLYDDDVVDKKALKKKCLSIYVDQVEKVARKNKVKEITVYLPMKQDRHGVWKVLVSDEIMKQLFGDLALPEGIMNESDSDSE